MLVKRTNPSNLPGILTEAAVGVDGVLVSTPEADNRLQEISEVVKEINPTMGPPSTTSRHQKPNRMSQTASQL